MEVGVQIPSGTDRCFKISAPSLSCSEPGFEMGLIFHRPYNANEKIRQQGRGFFYDPTSQD